MKSIEEVRRLAICAECESSSKNINRGLVCNFYTVDKVDCKEILDCGNFPVSICVSKQLRKQ